MAHYSETGTRKYGLMIPDRLLRPCAQPFRNGYWAAAELTTWTMTIRTMMTIIGERSIMPMLGTMRRTGWVGVSPPPPLLCFPGGNTRRPVIGHGTDALCEKRGGLVVRGRARGGVPARVAFGSPIMLQGNDYAALARQIEDALKLL